MTVDALNDPFAAPCCDAQAREECAVVIAHCGGLREAARHCLEERRLDHKTTLTVLAHQSWKRGALRLEDRRRDVDEPLPGLPEALRLTSPTRVPRRSTGPAGLVAFVHAIAHIEWNAINLAWDAVWRFDAMPRDYYDDWARVAAEEAQHFAMLRGRLRELGAEYGDLPAHAGLWQTAEATRDDLLDRMALVPRVLEARGLDVTPGIVTKLRRQGDERTARILDVVLRDEIGHVRIGSQWFHELCRRRGLEPAGAFAAAIRRHFRGRPQPVRGEEARRLRLEAGFLEEELLALSELALR